MPLMSTYYAGLDLGTSGARICVIDDQQHIVAEAKVNYSNVDKQTCQMWWQASCELIQSIANDIRQNIKYLAVDGTSGTLLLVNENGEPVTEPLLYNDHDANFTLADKDLSQLSDTFVRLLRLLQRLGTQQQVRVVTQADYIKGKFTNSFLTSDPNNCFKLGYDSVLKQWPKWMLDYDVTPEMLPEVVRSGSLVGRISPEVASKLKLNKNLQLVAGTTDSVAAVISTQINQVADAVTSLGSTLVLKVLSDKPITSIKHGVYSQPYFDKWLVGGASNCGGQVLRKYFDDMEMKNLTEQMDIKQPTGLNYYPLVQTGERFPVNDPHKKPVLIPRPDSDVVFFQGLLESLSMIENIGYQLLQELGAPRVNRVTTVGGGSNNMKWMILRERILGLPVTKANYTEAAYGSALLSMQVAIQETKQIAKTMS